MNRDVLVIPPEIDISIFLFILSLYALINAWRVLKLDREYLTPTQRAGLWLVKLIYGEKEQMRKKQKLTSPKNKKRLGIELLIAGILFFLMTVYFIVDNFFL